MRRFGLLPLALVAIAACTSEGEVAVASDEADLTQRFDPKLPEVDAQRYDVTLAVDPTPSNETFTATVKGTFVATTSLDVLTLDFEGNELDEVKVGATVVKAARSGARLSVPLPKKALPGTAFDVTVSYHGRPRVADGANPNDFSAFGGLMVKRKNAEGKTIFSSLDWPSKARRWLPLRDHPSDGAEVAFTVEFPSSFTVLANGKRKGVTDGSKSGTKVWRYEAKTAMPTYDFHLVAYEGYEESHAASASGIDLASYVYPKHHAAGAIIHGDLPDAMDFYEKTFGKYRWESATFLEEPIFGGGMEHASVVSLDETLYASPNEGRITAFQELAHHWSGNLVRIRDWSDFWLSEGFTEYLTHRFVADQDGAAAGEKVLRAYESRARSAFGRSAHPLRPKDGVDVLTIFDGISYQWGALTMRALERIVGTAEFTAFLAKWFDERAFTAVGTEDFQKALETSSGKDLSSFFDHWVYGKHGNAFPQLAVAVTATVGEKDSYTVSVTQTNPSLDGWYMPVDVDLVTATGTKRISLLLDGKASETKAVVDGAITGYVADAGHWFGGGLSCSGTGRDGKTGATCRE